MSSTSGGLRLTNVACGGASLRSTSGSVRFTRLRCESLEAKSVSGSIDGVLTGSADDYRFTASSTSGSVAVPAGQNGGREVRLRTTSGSIDVRTEYGSR